MASLYFAKGTSVPTTETLPDGGLYFNTQNKNIYFRNGETIVIYSGDEFDLPVADDDTLGGVKIGERLSITSDGVLSANKQSWSDIASKPSAFPPESHNHTKADITDFPSTMPPSSHSHSRSDITDFPTTMPPSSHQHSSEDVTSMKGYSKATAASAISTTDTLNAAIGKLEKGVSDAAATGPVTSVNGQTGDVTLSIPAAANNGILTIQQNGIEVGTFSANQSTNKVINIAYSPASTTSDGLMSKSDKENLNTLYAEWSEKNRKKLSITSLTVKGRYSYAESDVTTDSVNLLDGFSFTAKEFNWALSNTELLDKINLQYPTGTTTTVATNATTLSKDITDKVINCGDSFSATLYGYETVSNSVVSSKSISASSTYVIRYGADTNGSLTTIDSPSIKNVTGTTNTISNINALAQYVYLFLPANLYQYASLDAAKSGIKFFLNGAALEGGMTVVGSTTFTNTQGGKQSAALPYWVCRSSNKLTNTNIKIEVKV